MDFKTVYAQAMHDQAPKMWNRICRSGQLQAHLQEKSREAHALYRQLTGGKPASELTPSEDRAAEHQVFEVMLEFPDEGPEPKDPLGRNLPKTPPTAQAAPRLPPHTDPEIAEDWAIAKAFEQMKASREKGLTKEEQLEAALNGREPIDFRPVYAQAEPRRQFIDPEIAEDRAFKSAFERLKRLRAKGLGGQALLDAAARGE